ncbi:NAD(P)H-binding protein [Sphingomonas sp. HF-S3]|uniref:NAD(P)H-binding protein n=1 Tax=Sphingomonas rustica TaxID=3103142 RepID=A0ABV0B2N2_9SPHN
MLGATGRTGEHFTNRALAEGHRVRALVRSPEKLAAHGERIEVVRGSITDTIDTDSLVAGIDYVVVMLGDAASQRRTKINTAFMKRLIPSMRRQGVRRILYQAGALSRPHGGRLSPALWLIRNLIARSFIGQHRDNESVMAFLATQANDLEWIVHRAGIYSDGPSKGRLQRSSRKYSVASFADCADYNYRMVTERSAIHTADLSHYE